MYTLINTFYTLIRVHTCLDEKLSDKMSERVIYKIIEIWQK